MFRNLSPDAINIKTTLLEKLRLAKLGNFEGMDISIIECFEFSKNDRVEKIKNLFDYFDIKIGGWDLPFNIDIDENKFNENLEKLKKYLEIAQKISAYRVYTWIKPYSDEIPYEENFKIHKKRIKKICEIMEKYECKLGIEFVGTKKEREGHKYEFIWNLEQTLYLVKEINMENIGILLDSWHLYASGCEMENIKSLKGKDIICVHINDAPNIPKENLLDNERFLPGETGVIDAEKFLKILKEIGYEGPVTPEPFNKRVNELPDEIAVRLVGGYLLKIWNKIFTRSDLA
ncbi:MAG: sugar phosphate isomerase/epimerase [Candidatus Omnitrophica bacterium]|nr:sugar phosphate isomerase/epimerase [Candidatus Omnitrophota bacterium]MCM8806942.1 sugar phosphate isomerase/epimerase [Candidatus Omnitrophota bacterium]